MGNRTGTHEMVNPNRKFIKAVSEWLAEHTSSLRVFWKLCHALKQRALPEEPCVFYPILWLFWAEQSAPFAIVTCPATS